MPRESAAAQVLVADEQPSLLDQLLANTTIRPSHTKAMPSPAKAWLRSSARFCKAVITSSRSTSTGSTR